VGYRLSFSVQESLQKLSCNAMNDFEITLPEQEVSMAILADFVRRSGRNVLSLQSDALWVEGNRLANIQIGHVKNKGCIGVFAVRPMSEDLTYIDCALLANRLNTEFEVVRFHARFSEVARRHVVLIDHYTFYSDVLVVSHFLKSLDFVEYLALNLDLAPYMHESKKPH
jgi:hypothetical protein